MKTIISYFFVIVTLVSVIYMWFWAVMQFIRIHLAEKSMFLPVKKTFKSFFIELLSLFGIKCIKTDHFFILCKNARHSETLYFRAYVKGIGDFTLNRKLAWRFTSSEEARKARSYMAMYFSDMYIEEIITIKKRAHENEDIKHRKCGRHQKSFAFLRLHRGRINRRTQLRKTVPQLINCN